jgi:hypothetical protein
MAATTCDSSPKIVMTSASTFGCFRRASPMSSIPLPSGRPMSGDEHVGLEARDERAAVLAVGGAPQEPELRMACDRARQSLARVIVVLHEDDAVARPGHAGS